ncbi:MAG: glycoside hydrolase family 88 protein, partial [Sphaerochaeta sp.]|nr:glycoside hydrolase family 88 protein [Sphaerochaeta sp.]
MRVLDGYAELSEHERKTALDDSSAIVRNNLETFTYRCQNHSSVNNYYLPRDNDEWTTGFWPGEIWLAWEHTGDEVFSHAAQIHVESFHHRIVNKIAVDHHDMG